MTTVISRVYSDEAVASDVIDALSQAGFSAALISTIRAGDDAGADMIVARVPEMDIDAYLDVLKGKAVMVVVRAGFNPRGAARQAIAIVDEAPSISATVATQNAYIREKPRENLQRAKSILKDHPRWFSGDIKPGTGQHYSLISHAFSWPLVSSSKPRVSASRKSGHISTRFIPYTLLLDGERSRSIIPGGRRWFYNP